MISHVKDHHLSVEPASACLPSCQGATFQKGTEPAISHLGIKTERGVFQSFEQEALLITTRMSIWKLNTTENMAYNFMNFSKASIFFPSAIEKQASSPAESQSNATTNRFITLYPPKPPLRYNYVAEG